MNKAKLLVCAIILASYTYFVAPVRADAPGGDTVPNSAAVGGSPGIESVQGERLTKAVGHYTRARAMLMSALNEYDKGLKIANPDAIFDSREWRNSVVLRIKELQKVLDPQPRASDTGVKYEADSRLLGE